MNAIKIINRIYFWARIQTVCALGTGRPQISNLLEISIQDRNIARLCKKYRQKIMFSLCHLYIKEITSCTVYIAISRIQTDYISASVFIEKNWNNTNTNTLEPVFILNLGKWLNFYC